MTTTISDPASSLAARIRGRTIPFDAHPLLVIWELTQACDLACVHCRACAVAERHPLELTTEEGKRLLESVQQMGTQLVVLTGGDPVKRPDLVELVAHGTRLGLTMTVTPSGTELMTRNILAELKDAGLARVAVSIDGADPATHDAFRRVNGSFAHSMRILNDARELGIERQLNTTLAPHNYRTLETMSKLAVEAAVALWSVFVVVPTGRADSHMVLGSNDLETALFELAEIAGHVRFDVKTTAAPQYRRVLLERRSPLAALGVLHDVDENGLVCGLRGVGDGIGMVFVSHRGDIFPSGFLPLRAGNVREDNLANVYRNSPIFVQLRDPSLLKGKCGACPFKWVCGGSRARSHAVHGDMMQSDPACAYLPRGWVVQ